MSAGECDALYHRIPEGERIRNADSAVRGKAPPAFLPVKHCTTRHPPGLALAGMGVGYCYLLRQPCNRATVQRSDAQMHASEEVCALSATSVSSANEDDRELSSRPPAEKPGVVPRRDASHTSGIASGVKRVHACGRGKNTPSPLENALPSSGRRLITSHLWARPPRTSGVNRRSRWDPRDGGCGQGAGHAKGCRDPHHGCGKGSRHGQIGGVAPGASDHRRRLPGQPL